ncbi:MAG TPA: hypothetical protein VN802_21040 [Stellaceae bacterium]|nr:hypothetical protein [Stellaceae bacterium]
MTSKRHALLLKFVETLVEEWSYDEVQRALTELPDAAGGTHAASALVGGVSQHPSFNRGVNRSKRPTAVEQVTKLSNWNGERETLLVIAEKFDRKEFLPSIGDIREFLAMMGEASAGMKDRLDGFRRLLSSLTQLPPDKLKRLASSTSYSGPAQLGPLSDAIKSTGDAIRRSEMVPETEQKS